MGLSGESLFLCFLVGGGKCVRTEGLTACRILESLEAGKRLPETRFANLKVAPSGQGSVYAAFAKST